MESRRWVRFINGSAGLAYRRMSALTEEQPTVVEETPAEPRGSLRERWVPLGLVLGAGVWNFFFARLAETVDWKDWWAMPIYFVWGSLFAQPVLCAVWGASASQVWSWRLLIGTAANCFLALTMVTDGDVLSVLVFLMGIYFGFLIPLLLLRWKWCFVLRPQASSTDWMLSNASFGLGYLFAWMSFVAVFAGLARGFAGEAAQSNPGIQELALFTLMFLTSLAPPAWLFFYLLRTSQSHWRTLMLMALSVPLATLCATMVYTQTAPGVSFWDDGFWPIFFHCLGAMFTVALAARVFRYAGYRLYTLAPSP